MNEFTVIEELFKDLKAITPAQVERSSLTLGPLESSDTLIAEVTDPEAHRLYALGVEYERQHKLAVHAARFDASSKDERRQLAELASRFQALAEIALNMAWLRFRDVAPQSYGGGTLGLRENFSLVKAADQSESETEGIAIPISPQLFTGLASAFRRMREEREQDSKPKDPEKLKPQ